MKKSYTLFAAFAVAALLVGCSKDDVSSPTTANNNFNENEIGFLSSTSNSASTKADVVDIESIQGDDVGFVVYAVTNDGTDYYIGGEYYKYSSGSWVWDVDEDEGESAPEWPTVDTDYPITFYALYSNDYSNIVNYNKNTEVADGETPKADVEILEADITIGAVGKQFDILSTTVSTSSKPSGGKLSLDFSHILSRVNFELDVAKSATVYLQNVEFADLSDEDTFDILSTGWNGNEDVTTATYSYLSVTDEDILKIVYKDETGVSGNDATNVDLMLLPHTFTPWKLTSPVSGARVGMIYRLEVTGDVDYIGYQNAGDYPKFTDDNEHDVAKDDPLFVKVAVPLKTTGEDDTWFLGTAYDYTLTMGSNSSNNGYYVSTNYYDKNGNETEFPIYKTDPDDGDDPDSTDDDYEGEIVEIGDPVTTGEICFDVTVSNWDKGESTSLN